MALIPARGGSKRLPRKNLRPFFGHPMLAYGIAAARNSRLFERVLVSTDDPEIGAIACWYGAEYLPRPPAYADDSADLVPVGVHALETLEAEGLRPDALCVLLPNCPLRRSEDIVAQYQLFQEERRAFQISVVPYRSVYPHWALLASEEGRGSWLFGWQYVVNSQDLQTAYCPTGAVWWARTEPFLAQRAFYGDPFHLAIMDANRGIDLDRGEDLELADLLVRGLRDRDGESPLEPIGVAAYPG